MSKWNPAYRQFCRILLKLKKIFNTRKTLDPKQLERYCRIKRKNETSQRHCISHSAESIASIAARKKVHASTIDPSKIRFPTKVLASWKKRNNRVDTISRRKNRAWRDPTLFAVERPRPGFVGESHLVPILLNARYLCLAAITGATVDNFPRNSRERERRESHVTCAHLDLPFLER